MSVAVPRLAWRDAAIAPVRQTEPAEAGLACLAMIAGHHGLAVDLGLLRRQFMPPARGASIEAMIATADALGLTARLVLYGADGLGRLALPAILRVDHAHFLVLEKVGRKKATVHDPALGTTVIATDALLERATGEALELAPSADFEPGEVGQKLKLRHLWTSIRGARRAIAQVLILSTLLQVFALVSPYYLQLAIDVALPERNFAFLSALAIGFCLLVLINGATTMLRASVLLFIGSSFGYGLYSNVARKMFRLPVTWFERRSLGDILLRFRSVAPIRRMLTEDAPAIMVDGALALLTLVLMFLYAPLLAAISAASLLLYALVKIAFFRAHRRSQEVALIESSLEHSSLIETLRAIRTIRLSAQESLRHSLWQTRIIASINADTRNNHLKNWQAAIQTAIFGLENVIVIWLAVGMVMKEQLTLGMVFAFVAYKMQFLTAGGSLINKGAEFKMMGLHLERLADIALTGEDVSFSTGGPRDRILQGSIELRGIQFKYEFDDRMILRGVDLRIEAGESVAITGSSGCGKSTLVHIMTGLLEPDAGEILIDGTPLHSFGHKNYHRQIAAILQDDTLFAGSIADNITMFSERADMAQMKEAAAAAAIADDIEAMPMAYETLVGDMGAALSGGQRQRLMLARALYRRPKILFMDEGTAHLDEALERIVNRAVARLGITRVIVAHRAETIASADRVLRLEQGRFRDEEG